MKVVICEDHCKHRQLLNTEIMKYSTFHEPSIEIVLSASRPEEIISYIANQRADCYFLDIELESQLNGLELAQEIRKRDPFASIIFITHYADSLKLTFKYKLAALDFIVKDGNSEISQQIIGALKAAFEKYKQIGNPEEEHFFQVRIGERIKNIRLDDIYYFETSPQIHKIGLHEKHGYYEFYGKLKNIVNIDDRFFQNHKSYILNLQHVKEINKKERIVTITNGHNLPVSHRSLSDLEKKLKVL